MRLSIEITQEQHQYLKAAAAIQGKSIKNYVLERALPDAEEQRAFSQLENLLNARAQSAKNGKLSENSLDNIFDEEIEKSK